MLPIHRPLRGRERRVGSIRRCGTVTTW